MIDELFNWINNNCYTFSIKENSNELIEELEIDEKFSHDIINVLFVWIIIKFMIK